MIETGKQLEISSIREELKEFKEKTDAFYAGEMDKGAYKSFSGRFGSYAQKGGQASMLRLRMPAGRVTKKKLKFVADAIASHQVKRAHFTTCQTIQLHDLSGDDAYEIMSAALDAGIITLGGGGDFPRNVMCSPLSGVEQGECFDTLPWAEAAGEYLMTFIHAQKMPRKLKVAFSNSPKNITHATYRDLGFAARPDGKFDVYSAGGLGNNPRLGVLVAEAVEPSEILYYIKAMWLTFLAYGNYGSRAKARTRYMQEALGGPEAYAKAYQEKLAEVYASGEELKLSVTEAPLVKQGDGSTAEGFRVIPQKQEGLYSVLYHPIGGQPPITWFASIYELIQDMQDVELRLSPDETIYIINLTGTEAQAVLKATEGGAETLFETSVSCIGGTTCQVGPRDSQGLLAACVKAVREADLPADALPQIHISGCTSSCGTHQTGAIGFNGTVKMIDKVAHPAFFLHVNGREGQADACIGTQLGAILETDIPSFLVELGRTVAESALSFSAWRDANPGKLEELAGKYIG